MRHVFVGVVLVALGFWGMMAWWVAFGVAMRGLVPLALLVIGLLALLSGFQRMKPADDYEVDERDGPVGGRGRH